MIYIEVRKDIENVFIKNAKYEGGVSDTSGTQLPDIGVPYLYLQYGDSPMADSFWIDEQNIAQALTEKQIDKLTTIVSDWEQPLGEEGNPTLEQTKMMSRNKLELDFNTDVLKLSTALPHEMASWRKQEEQARSWNLDNSLFTPMVDAILTTRTLGETKQELVDKIIANADAYEVAYGSLLGKFQSLVKTIEGMTTINEVEEIVWQQQ